jgi:DNA-binding MarR family transcriptional regulator
VLASYVNLVDIACVTRGEPTPTLLYLIKWMERRSRLELEVALAPLDVSVAEFTALSVLAGRELSSAQLARRTFVSAQAMHPIVTELLQKHLVQRRVDPGHGRIQLIKLSPQGKAKLVECHAASQRAESAAFGGLSSAERESLRRALDRSVRAISATGQADEQL